MSVTVDRAVMGVHSSIAISNITSELVSIDRAFIDGTEEGVLKSHTSMIPSLVPHATKAFPSIHTHGFEILPLDFRMRKGLELLCSRQRQTIDLALVSFLLLSERLENLGICSE